MIRKEWEKPFKRKQYNRMNKLIEILISLVNNVIREHLYNHANKDYLFSYKSKEAEHDEIKNTVIKEVENLLRELKDIL